MNRSDFQQLAELRLRESRSLLAAGFPEGAYYLAGYSVECAFKAGCTTPEWDLPQAEYFPIVLTVYIAVRWRYERSIASCCAPPPFRRPG
jgi:hypothetical protein